MSKINKRKAPQSDALWLVEYGRSGSGGLYILGRTSQVAANKAYRFLCGQRLPGSDMFIKAVKYQGTIDVF